jgi:cytosine/adenosine deaminase-related metal-dependent hydrolase
MRTLIKDVTILDPSSPLGYREGDDILIEGQKILAVGRDLKEGRVDEVREGRRLLAMPGLVNAHTHSAENLGKASHEKLPLEPWLQQMIFRLGHFSPRAHYLAAAVGALETLRTGGTAILDHLTLPGGYHMEVLDAVMEAYRDVGIRARVAPLMRDFSEAVLESETARFFALGHFGGDALPVPDEDEMFALAGAFIDKWHLAEGGRLRGHIGPGGIQWATIPFLHRCHELAISKGVGVHTHLMETRVQDRTVRELHGMSAVAMLKREKLLSPRWSFPHSIWLTREDVEDIAEAGAVPVHNPTANMRLGSGWSPIRKFLDAGCVPGLGADGSMSGDHQNMMVVMHMAAQIHNCHDAEAARWIGSREVWRMATEGGARALMQEEDLGVIEAGKLADITFLDLNHLSMTPLNDAFTHLAYTVPVGAVKMVMVDGRMVIEDGVSTLIDEDALLSEVREAAAALPVAGPLPQAVQDAVERMTAGAQQIRERGSLSGTSAERA